MARPRMTFSDDVHRFVDHISKEEDYAERTLRFYRDEGACVFSLLDEHIRPGVRARDVTKREVLELVAYMREKGYAVQTMKGYMTALRKVCLHAGNAEPAATKIRWPRDMRPSVDWLTQDQAQALLDHPKSPIQGLIVHLELCMGLRRIEVARLRMQDIDYRSRAITVTGKASKLRLVPFHPDTEEVLRHFLEYRDALITVARYKDPGAIIPDNLLIWGKGRQLSSYSEKKLTGMDKHTKALCAEVGFNFSNHTLRRTFGRIMYRSHVPLATIAKLLGHESTDVTLDYIGVDLDDMGSAMKAFALRAAAEGRETTGAVVRSGDLERITEERECMQA